MKKRDRSGFIKRNERFVDYLPHLYEIAEKIVVRTSIEAEEFAPGIILMINRTIVEEFSEVLVMGSYDYGFAAKRLLRGMYERVLASLYFETHPAETKDFVDF